MQVGSYFQIYYHHPFMLNVQKGVHVIPPPPPPTHATPQAVQMDTKPVEWEQEKLAKRYAERKLQPVWFIDLCIIHVLHCVFLTCMVS